MIFPDHITRNDMAIDESVGESSYQYCLQVHLRNCTLVFFLFFSLLVCSGYFTSSLSLPLWKQELHQEPPQRSPLTAFCFPPSPASPASVSGNSRFAWSPTVSILHVCIVFAGEQCCCCYCCRLWFMVFTPPLRIVCIVFAGKQCDDGVFNVNRSKDHLHFCLPW